MNQHDQSGWVNVAIAASFWLVGHVTLSNLALCVSIGVGLLQGYKTLREIRRQRRMEDES